MHRSLEIPEIVCMIAQCLSRPPDFVYLRALPCESNCTTREEAIKRQALLSLSLTSRSLLEPCLDALWGCMLSARPLFDIIVPLEGVKPGDGGYPQYHEVMGPPRFLENADWTRFHYYASRIKGLIVCAGDLDVILNRALSSRSSTHAPLLPNLRYLYWADRRVASLPCINHLAGPNVTCLKLGFTANRMDCEQAVYATLMSLRETCPLLEDMSITHCSRSEDVPDWRLILLFSMFSNITSVRFSSAIPGDTLICLSRMANLRALKGTFNPTDPFISSTTVPLDFASLQHLHWTVCDLSEAAALLRRLQPPGRAREFQSLTFERNNCDIDSDVLKLFLNTLLSTCSTQTLSSLALEDGSVPDIMDGEDDCRALGTVSADLRPLFQFGCIEVLRLECLPVVLDDAFIAAATTWPRLRVLRLLSHAPWECAITPAGLLLLARQCRRLEELEVEIGSWPDPIPPPPYGSADMGRRDVPLFVYIRHSVIVNEVERTARLDFIRGIFPNADVAYECEELI